MDNQFDCENGFPPFPEPPCEWVAGGDACSGTCTGCGTYLNQGTCNAQSGCSWVNATVSIISPQNITYTTSPISLNWVFNIPSILFLGQYSLNTGSNVSLTNNFTLRTGSGACCGGGTNWTNIVDGDWGTWGYCPSYCNFAFGYDNSKIANLSNNFAMVKDSNGIFNYTIPQACMKGSFDPAFHGGTLGCYTSGGAWLSMGGSGSTQIYELVAYFSEPSFFNTTINPVVGSNSVKVWTNSTPDGWSVGEVFFTYQSLVSTFVSQSPDDVNSLNLFGDKGLNITYNITSVSGINESTVKLFYKTNTSAEDCWIWINGVQQVCGWRNLPAVSNDSDSWLFRLFDNGIYPAIYNFDEFTMENTVHSSYNLSTDDAYVKIRFYNVSSSKQYSIYEVMANSTVNTSGTALRIYYCNDSYSTGDPDLSPSCTNFYNLLGNVPYNHTHSAYSSHMLIPFAIDNVTGLVNELVMATPISYFVLRGNSTDWNVFFINDDTGSAQVTTNNGTAWTNLTGTVDSHLHQYDGTDSLWYFVNSCDITGYCENTTSRQDLLQTGGLPPTAPFVYRPQESLYRGLIAINYTLSVSPNGYAIVSYNVSLLNSNISFNMTLVGNNSPNLDYVFDSTAVPDGSYRIGVEDCDSSGQCSIGLSEIFSVDNTEPNVTIIFPQDITFEVADIPLVVSADSEISLWEYSLNGDSNTTFTPNTTVTGVEGLNSIVVYATDLAGNVGSSVMDFTISLPRPSAVVTTLGEAGSGLGMFLDSITSPVTNVVLGLGLVGGILVVVFAIGSAIRRAFNGSTQTIE